VEPDALWNTSYAPARPRLLAGLIDGFMSAVMFVGSIFVVAIVEGLAETVIRGEASDELTATGTLISIVLWLVVSFLYQAIPISRAAQATPGM
jgi:uncharacterized RDD family membrane protein YckC